MTYSIIDIEANGLLDNATKIHCLCVNKIVEGKSYTSNTTDYNLMRTFFEKEEILIGHNIQRYDILLIEKILGIKVKARLIDTLAISWYLYPNRLKHGLEEWGGEFGIQKPPILDWDNLPPEQYIYRCGEDVKINTELWNIQRNYLKEVYGDAGIDKILRYIEYKMDCAREQEEVKWRINVEKTKKNLEFFYGERGKRMTKLSEIMPETHTYKIRSKPKVMVKQDGELSEHGKRWEQLLKEQELPEYHNGAIKLVDKTLPGNPGSIPQLKEWLFSLGWKPTTFKYEIKDGKKREIPQISADDGSGICSSVQKLYPKMPELVELEDLFVVRHRIGILEGFLETMDEDGFVKAEINGLTNTLRFQHKKPLANLPTIPKKYWDKIRGVLIAPSDEYELCGSDMSGLEDNCKQHYIYFFDPQYVIEMRTPGFDSHIDIAELAKKISWEEGEFYKWYINKKEGTEYKYLEPKEGINRFDNNALESKYTYEQLVSLPEELQAKIIKILKPIRLKTKKVNFASVYGAGAAKIAATGNMPLLEAREFHTIYWMRNKAVKQVAASCITKMVRNQAWLYNPVSKFWLSLRADKDKFSTLNQSTGAYCFDLWNKYVRERGIKICGQFHDEIIAPVKKGNRDYLTGILNEAIDKTNNDLKLNVPLKISIDYGDNYSQIH